MRNIGDSRDLANLMETILINYGIDMTDLDEIAEELPSADVSSVYIRHLIVAQNCLTEGKFAV